MFSYAPMRRFRSATFFVLLLALANCGWAQGARDPLSVELFAARMILRDYKAATIEVDSFYALAGHAPPPTTTKMRPRVRDRALRDSLQPSAGASGGSAVTVRASEPVIRGDEARIFVTIDEVRTSPKRRKDYETVGFVLDWRDGRWVIRERIVEHPH